MPDAISSYRPQTNYTPSDEITGHESEEVQQSVPDEPVCQAPSPAPGEPSATDVYLCSRAADYLWNAKAPKDLQLDHHWLKTPNMERGMGPKDGGIPGHNSSEGMPGCQTTVNDHTGESEGSDATCKPLPGIDADCVEKEMELGRPTGRWTPANNCQTYARDVIKKCDGDPNDGAVEVNSHADQEQGTGHEGAAAY